MSGRPNKPIEAYPTTPAAELPAPPPVDPAGAEGGDGAALAAAPSRAEVAVLDFLDTGATRATVALKFPFRLDGFIVRAIDVRRVSLIEAGRVADQLKADGDNFPLYAIMTGLPPPVLRGLMAEDMEALIAACDPLDVLPAGAASSPPTSPSGEGSRSSP